MMNKFTILFLSLTGLLFSNISIAQSYETAKKRQMESIIEKGSGVFTITDDVTISGDLGIGTTSPSWILDLDSGLAGGAGFSGTLDNISDISANEAVRFGRTGTATGERFGLILGVNSSSSAKMQSAIFSEKNAGGWGVDQVFYTQSTAANTGEILERMRIDADGNVGIGTASPSNTLDVIGGYIWADYGILIGADTLVNAIRDNTAGAGSSTTLYIGNASINVTSDKRYKKNIVPSKFKALDAISKIEINDFNWNDPTDISYNNRNARGLWTGFMAQQAIKYIPFMINAPRKEETLQIDYESDSRWGVDTGAAIGVFFKAFQEQQKIIDTQKNEIGMMKSWICSQPDSPLALCD